MNRFAVLSKLKILRVHWSNFQAIPVVLVRLAFVSSLEDVETRLEDALTKSPRRLAAQVFWGEGSEAQKVAFLFPGQGSQYVGMMQSLAEESPGVAEVFERGEKALKPLIHGSLKDIVWGDREDPNVAGAAAADGNLSACHAYSRHRDDALAQ